MRFSALRIRFLALTVLFALVLVGTVSLVSYFVVTDAMVDTADSTLLGLASTSSTLIYDSITVARTSAADRGLSGRDLEIAAYADVVENLPKTLPATEVGGFALYGPDSEVVWSSSPAALNDYEVGRFEALDTGRIVEEEADRIETFSGLLTAVDMGRYVAHVPIELPGQGRSVLDVTYLPDREEATIDSMRPWMLSLAAVATILAVVLMQVSTGWVLGLVGSLREAAESIDANRLDVHLPDLGRNEIGDLARSLNGLLDRLRARSEAQTRFVADASHELATPVAGIRGYVNILREWGGEDPALREEAIEAIDRESSRMARLCGDLLSLIRRERFEEFAVRRVDVNAAAREALADAATRYMEKGIEFAGPPEGPLEIVGDPDRIFQLMSILVDNAAKYTGQGGSVSIRTWRRLDSVFVEVSDTGVGIPEADLPYVFERFYRSDQSRSATTGGFGIGLSVAREIVEASGGDIDVYSVERTGTTFTVRLPRRTLQQELG